MNCQEALEAISAAIDGELSPDERAALDAHLASCPACAALLEELSGQSRLLREMDCQVPEGLSARILADLPSRADAGTEGAQSSVTPFPSKKRPALWRRLGTLAACLALVIWAGASFLPGTLAGRYANTVVSGTEHSSGSKDAAPAEGSQIILYAPAAPNGGGAADGFRDAAPAPGVNSFFQKSDSAPAYACSLLLDAGAAPEEPETVVLTGTGELSVLLESCSEALLDRDGEPDEALLFDSGAAIAVALPETEGCAGYAVNGVFPAETGGYDISLTPIPSQPEGEGAAGYLVLIAADGSLSPSDTFTVSIED